MNQAEIATRVTACFVAEKREAVLFIAAGIAALAVSVAMFCDGGAIGA